MRSILFLLIGSIVIGWLSGCGSGEQIPQLVPVQGTITINGNPGANLMVTFAPQGTQDVGVTTGKTDAQGAYTLNYKGVHPGAPQGRYRVSIQHLDPAEVPDEELLPSRYNDETELTADVTADPKSYDFDL